MILNLFYNEIVSLFGINYSYFLNFSISSFFFHNDKFSNIFFLFSILVILKLNLIFFSHLFQSLGFKVFSEDPYSRNLYDNISNIKLKKLNKILIKYDYRRSFSFLKILKNERKYIENYMQFNFLQSFFINIFFLLSLELIFFLLPILLIKTIDIILFTSLFKTFISICIFLSLFFSLFIIITVIIQIQKDGYYATLDGSVDFFEDKEKLLKQTEFLCACKD